jgi:hypothetical protein
MLVSDEHEMTVYGRAEAKLTKKITDGQTIDELGEYDHMENWEIDGQPQDYVYRCSCGESFHSGMRAELHLHGENGDTGD